jgi:hypothetical protein
VHTGKQEHPAGHREDRHHLGHGEQCLHAPADHDACAVDERKQRDHADRHQLARAELQREAAAEEVHGAHQPLPAEGMDVGDMKIATAAP